MLYPTPFPKANALTINTNQHVTAPRQPVGPLQYVVYFCNFRIPQKIVNYYEYKVICKINMFLT